MKQLPGFTLPELLAALAVFSISIGIALPSFTIWVGQSESRAAASTLASAINLARSSAISHNNYAILCASPDGISCSSDWNRPLLVFIDADRDGSLDSDEHHLATYDLLPRGASLRWRGFGSNRYIRFKPSGLTDGSNGSLTYCSADNNAKLARQLVIATGGRLRQAIDHDGDGIREDSNGYPLRCS